jgi:GTPase
VLKPSQQYNLAKVCKIDILDRERLILDIFELRASTAESRIQIKLAQLRYDMVRAREKVRLARAGEQPGFFGMGKYDADVYFLDIKKRSAILKKKLEREEKRREENFFGFNDQEQVCLLFLLLAILLQERQLYSIL